jgi:hypothetical protein
MKRLEILKPDTIIGAVNVIGVPLSLIFAISMIVWPWIAGHGNWEYVQSVWDRWQSLNVGLLAFISSVIAFNIARYNNDRQRAREFLAAKASLPATLSSLTDYFSESSKFLLNAWKTTTQSSSSPSLAIPSLPHGCQSVFAECIRHAEPEVGEYLAKILARLQIHDSRMRSCAKALTSPNVVTPIRHNLVTYFFRLGELQAMVDKLFNFARNIGEFDRSPPQWPEFENSYSVLGLCPSDIVVDTNTSLESFTKRRISSGLEFNA